MLAEASCEHGQGLCQHGDGLGEFVELDVLLRSMIEARITGAVGHDGAAPARGHDVHVGGASFEQIAGLPTLLANATDECCSAGIVAW